MRYHKLLFDNNIDKDESILSQVFLLNDFSNINELNEENKVIVHSYITYLSASNVDTHNFNISEQYIGGTTKLDNRFNFVMKYTEDTLDKDIIKLLSDVKNKHIREYRRYFKYNMLPINGFNEPTTDSINLDELWLIYIKKVSTIYNINILLVLKKFNELTVDKRYILQRDLDVFNLQ